MKAQAMTRRNGGRRAIARWGGVALAVLVTAWSIPRASAAAGLTEKTVRAAADYSARHRGRSLLVLQHGKVVWESYANGGSARTALPIYSGTKAFWAVATLVAAQEGLLRLDERASETLGEWRDDPRRKGITLRELLDFTSGLDPCFPLHSDRVADRNAAALRAPVAAARGSAFTYGPSHGQVLCEVLRRKLAVRGTTPFGYLRQRVLDPLRIGAPEYRKDRQGNPLVASGFLLTARQWSKFGQMLLERGRCDGRMIVEQAWWESATRGSRANPCFGFGLWLNRAAGRRGARETDIEKMLERPWQRQEWRDACLCRHAPADLVASVGSGYQRLFVIPSLEVVIVRQGQDARFSDAEFLRTILGR
jgi:CubicO group peptidase (beta-lactamase class C family)